MSSNHRDYQQAINLLNSLQSNAATIAKMKGKNLLLNLTSLPDMRMYLARIGYEPKDLKHLHFIHIAGTKGKGSTAAFTHSLLSRFGWNHHKLLDSSLDSKVAAITESKPLKTGISLARFPRRTLFLSTFARST